jgi:hypothetical protein
MSILQPIGDYINLGVGHLRFGKGLVEEHTFLIL